MVKTYFIEKKRSTSLIALAFTYLHSSGRVNHSLVAQRIAQVVHFPGKRKPIIVTLEVITFHVQL